MTRLLERAEDEPIESDYSRTPSISVAKPVITKITVTIHYKIIMIGHTQLIYMLSG